MYYKFENKNYHVFNVFEDNKLAARNYFIPFKSRESCDRTDYLEERYKSDCVISLSGKWDFAYFDRVSKMPAEIDTYDFDFVKTDVPGCWQFQGFEKPFYVNSRYQFDYNQPDIPSDEGTCGKNVALNAGGEPVKVFNSVGLYRKTFRLARKARHVVTFLGAAGCLELYVNGRYVGYSEGSHNSAEFDITGYVVDGPNEIVVLVYKWSNGTYLECQDMFRNNGIFRDVYVTTTDKNSIRDFKTDTARGENNIWTLSIDVTATLEDGAYIDAELRGDGFESAAKVEDGKCVFKVSNPALWSDETPALYTLYLTVKNKKDAECECVRQEVGFKQIEIRDNVFYFNDKPIKLKGVNHHDTNPLHGYTMSVEDWVKDVELMKKFNVNTMRTSHYPPDPIALKIANRYGLYVIDEADIETHGAYAKKLPQPNHISNDKKWRSHYWDRVYRMYMRDLNNPCVIMWSLGNESGGWKNQDYCYAMLKTLGVKTPIHYEGVCRTPRWAYDVVSQMYASTEFYDKYAEGKAPKKFYRAPYLQCEYAHAMGVGPGSLDTYWEDIYKRDSALGGCIWEWADHAVRNKDGSYSYGGDNGEYCHDNNFCVDGLFFPDRTPHTGALCMRNVYRPVRAGYVSNNKYVLTNKRYFKDTSDIKIEWRYSVGGLCEASGVIEESILPGADLFVELKHPYIDTTKDCFIDFVYTDKASGEFIADEQIVICQNVPKASLAHDGEVAYIEENDKAQIITGNGKIVFDKSSGSLVGYTVDGVSYLGGETVKGFVPTLYRPPIDNYMYADKRWKKQGLDNVKTEFVSFEALKSAGQVTVKTLYSLYCLDKPRFNVEIEYCVHADSVTEVRVRLRQPKGYDLPKFGLTLELDGAFKKVKYYGRGKYENYADLSAQSTIGVYETDVLGMYEKYIRPQDSGNRCDVRWATLEDEDGNKMTFRALGKAFNFCALPFEDNDVVEATHSEQLKPRDICVVKVDGFMRGVGSNSCGSDTRAEFKCKNGADISYAFEMAPETGKAEKAKAAKA